MTWTTHKPKDCRLGKDQSECLKPPPLTTFHANIATGEKSSKSSLTVLMSQLAAALAD